MAFSSRTFICSDVHGGCQMPLTERPSQTAPHPVRDASVEMTCLLCGRPPRGTPLSRNSLFLQGRRAQMQARETHSLTCLSSLGWSWKALNQHWKGRDLSRPSGTTTAAAAIKPSSLWTLLAVTSLPSRKCLRVSIKLSALRPVRDAFILAESKRIPRNTAC